MGNFYVVVIDGLGIGAQPDSRQYGDEEADTLGHVCEVTQCTLPNFEKLGLGNIESLESVRRVPDPMAAYGKMKEHSPGKDSTTGHWELAGIHLEQPFPTYPDGFPDSVIRQFCKGIGVNRVLCNKPYSGTEVIRDYGAEHLETGLPIVYTSADSVFQVAAHLGEVPVDTLYEWCKYARDKVLTGRHRVGRVIARPFAGETGSFERISEKRHDFSVKPPELNLVADCRQNGVATYSIGKVVDLFGEHLFTQYRRTKSNAEGISQLLSLMSAVEDSLVFVNFIDTDQKYGHRLDPDGFARSLEEIDRALPALIDRLQKDDLLIITGDHGNDPTAESTDHSREYVPLLVYPEPKAFATNLGTRESFSDVAVTAERFFGLDNPFPGTSFLGDD